MADSEARQALAREVQRALSAGGLSVAAASRAMDVEPKRLYRWLKGEVSPRLDEVERFANAINQALTLRIGPETTEKPQPDWAGAMEQRLVETILSNRDTVIQALAEQPARYGVEQALASQPPGEPPPDKQGPQRERAVRR